MQIVVKRPMAVDFGEKTIIALISAVAAAAVAWLISAFTKASKQDVDEQLKQLRQDFKEERQALQVRMARIEDRGGLFVTREEFQKHVDDLKIDIRTTINDLKGEVVNLRSAVLKDK